MKAFAAPIVLILWACWTVVLDGSLSGLWVAAAVAALVVQVAHWKEVRRG